MAHDPKCRELSDYFLPSTASEELKVALADTIQDAIEDFIENQVDVVVIDRGIQ